MAESVRDEEVDELLRSHEFGVEGDTELQEQLLGVAQEQLLEVLHGQPFLQPLRVGSYRFMVNSLGP